jgi:predicted dehydrogenase
MVVGELAELSAQVSTQVPQWFETDTKKYVEVTSPDNIMVHGRLASGAVVNACCGIHPYHGSGHRFEIYGTQGTLMMIGGGEGGEELRRKIMGGHKDDKTLLELAVPERFTRVPETLRSGPAYDIGETWIRFVGAIRNGLPVDGDFDHAVRRHRTLDAIMRASQSGERQKINLA